VADPSRETGSPARAPTGPAVVSLRAHRPPRAANDNAFPWLKQASRVLPLLAAVALLVWALVHAFGVL